MLWLRLAPRLARAARPLARFAVPATAIGVASLAKPASCSPFGDEIDATMRELLDEDPPAPRARGRADVEEERAPETPETPTKFKLRDIVTSDLLGEATVVGVGAGPGTLTYHLSRRGLVGQGAAAEGRRK